MAMITSQANSPWPLDCPIADLTSAGLPAPSKVRFKLFTSIIVWCAASSGSSRQDAEVVRAGLASLLGGAP
jgi:mRNA interferase MazF